MLCRVVGLLLNNEFERMWKNTVVVHVEVPCRHVPGETEGNHKNSIGVPPQIRVWLFPNKSLEFLLEPAAACAVVIVVVVMVVVVVVVVVVVGG